MLEHYLNALNWQGGTYTQVLQEIKRLKKLETETKKLMTCLAFRAQQKKFKPYQDELEILNAINQLTK